MANLNKNSERKLWGKRIVRVFLSKVEFWGKGTTIVRGHILLEGGTVIQIKSRQFLIVIDGKTKGAVLETSPNYNRIKRLIAIEFKTFRKGSKASLIDRIPDLRVQLKDGMDNCKRSNLLKHAS